MGESALNAVGFILGTLFSLYAGVVALRFIMQVVRADYYNPIAQFVVKATDPLLKPLRRIIPSVAGYDTASLFLCFAVLVLKFVVFKLLALGYVPALGSHLNVAGISAPMLVIAALIDLVYLFFSIIIYAIFIQALLSWIPSAGANPVAGLLQSITSPVLRPIRKILPPMGGLDLSSLATIIVLFALRMFVVGALVSLFLH